MAKRRKPPTSLAVNCAVFKAHRCLHDKIHKFSIMLLCFSSVGWLFFPDVGIIWAFAISLSLLEIVLKSLFQPRIVQTVNAYKLHGPYRGASMRGMYYDMPKLYIAETGSYGTNGRPILGLYAGEDIDRKR